MTITSYFFDTTSLQFFVTLPYFFQVSGPSLMSISGLVITIILVVKDLTRNPEIENTPVWVLSIVWRLGQVRVTKFGMNVSNKKFLMLKNVKFTTFTISELSTTHARRLELMFTFMTFLQWKRWSKNEMVRLHWTDDTILCYFPNSLMQGTNVSLWIYKCDALHDLVSFV